MKVIRENKVEMSLAGKPRWWTVEIKGKRWECVRVDHQAINDQVPILYVFLPPGSYKWPPLVAPAFKAGGVAFDQVRELGGLIMSTLDKGGKRCELRLAGGLG